MRPRRFLAGILLLLPLWLMAFPACSAEQAKGLEPQVKAAFLYKFASYVDWPAQAFPEPDTPITIAVIGAEPIVAELSPMVTGRTAQGRPITVKRLKAGESVVGISILFIGGAEAERLGQWIQAAQAHPILVVTDSKDALAQGSAINFVLVDHRLRFEISVDAAEKSGLKLSSRLLAVAHQVLHTGAP